MRDFTKDEEVMYMHLIERREKLGILQEFDYRLYCNIDQDTGLPWAGGEVLFAIRYKAAIKYFKGLSKAKMNRPPYEGMTRFLSKPFVELDIDMKKVEAHVNRNYKEQVEQKRQYNIDMHQRYLNQTKQGN